MVDLAFGRLWGARNDAGQVLLVFPESGTPHKSISVHGGFQEDTKDHDKTALVVVPAPSVVFLPLYYENHPFHHTIPVPGHIGAIELGRCPSFGSNKGTVESWDTTLKSCSSINLHNNRLQQRVG